MYILHFGIQRCAGMFLGKNAVSTLTAFEFYRICKYYKVDVNVSTHTRILALVKYVIILFNCTHTTHCVLPH